MNKHTPGPWKAFQARQRIGDDPVWSVWTGDEGYGIAIIDGCGDNEANARIIAASPSLYATAKRLLYPVPGETLDVVMAALREAVEQAEGRETS